jgi:CBS domain-containing protein
MKKVRDFMNKQVFFVKPEFSIFDVARVFAKNDISGAPVVDKGKVVGVVSVSDLTKFMSIKLADAEIIADAPGSLSLLLLNFARFSKDYIGFKKEMDRISKTKIKNIMSKNVVCVTPETNLFEAANIMDKKDVNRLPVVDKGKLIGIISRADILKALVE